ncbi:MAG: GNAT family N-acetyltransferase [Actinomycetota bacterium]
MVEIRPTNDDNDLERWVAIHNVVIPDDAITAQNLRSWMDSARSYSRLLAFEDGELVAVASAVIEPGRPESIVSPLVPTESRRRGLGSALFDELVRWAGGQGCDALLTHVEVGDQESIGFAERRGFTEIGRELRVALDLTGELPEFEPPDGVELLTWAERPGLVKGIYEVYLEGAADIPGEEDSEILSFEDWLAYDMSGSGDRPEWTFLAVAGTDVVGYSKWSLTEAQPHTAHHDLTAVKRAWRGRGIAGSLKSRQLRWAKENGYTRAVTQNEERNTPIRRLNERFGYLPAGGRILLRRPR